LKVVEKFWNFSYVFARTLLRSTKLKSLIAASCAPTLGFSRCHPPCYPV